MSGGWPLKQNDTPVIYLPPKHVLRCIERQATFYGLLCRRDEGTKKNTRGGKFTPPHPIPTKATCINFGMWGRVLDVINHAKFWLDPFRGFGAPDGRISLSPIDWRYRPYNSVRTNVLHCDSAVKFAYSRRYSEIAGRMVWPPSFSCDRKWPYSPIRPKTTPWICVTCVTPVAYKLEQSKMDQKMCFGIICINFATRIGNNIFFIKINAKNFSVWNTV